MAVLPLIVLIGFLIFFKAKYGFKESFLRAATVWGVTVFGLTELLSAFNAISFVPLFISWLVLTILTGVLLSKVNAFSQKNAVLFLPHFEKHDLWFFLPLLVSLSVTLIIALIAPPSTWDSMTYHMGRIVHWIQNKNVAHYPTHIERQIFYNPFTEYVILNFQILNFGSDRFANLVQWLAFLGTIIATAGIAEKLLLKRSGQWLSALLVAATPMVIMQSTSTQNDLFCAFWLSSSAYFIVSASNRSSTDFLPFIAISFALAVAAKGTAYIFGVPLLVWFLIHRLAATTLRKVFVAAGTIAFVVVLLNAPLYNRNFKTYGNPFGQPGEFSSLRNEVHSLKAFASTVTKNAVMHLRVPYQRWNDSLTSSIDRFHTVIGFDINDPRTTWGSFHLPDVSNHEDQAPNPIPFVLLTFSLAAFLFASNRIRFYGLCVLSGFLLFCFSLKWQPWHTRLHTPFFVLSSPFIAAFLERSLTKKRTLIVTILIFASSLPWLLFNASRPLITVESKKWPGIFSTPRESLYFVTRPYLQDSYLKAVEQLSQLNCKTVGLILNGDDWEYPIWQLSKERGLDIDFHHVLVKNPSISNENGQNQLPVCALLNLSDGDQWSHPGYYSDFTRTWKSGSIGLYQSGNHQ